MNNLRKFSTEAEYSAATLVYPSVSWVTSGDTVHFDKTAPVVINDKVMMAWTSDTDGADIVMYNSGVSIDPSPDVYFSAITLNNVDVLSSLMEDGTLENYSIANINYLAKYGITTTTVEDYFSGSLGGGWKSEGLSIDFLVPSQVTVIDYLPTNTQKLVIEATTPPTTSLVDSYFSNFQGLYVPDASVTAYQSAWGGGFSSIYPISQYSGNLPV